MAKALDVVSQAPQPILKGRHLVELGLAPGREFGPLLAAAYEAQLDGVFPDLPHALRWLGQQEHLAVPDDVRSALLQRARGNP